jgi:hypothetical protein
MTRTMLDREAELRHLQRSMERHTAVAVFAAAERFVRLSNAGDPDAAATSNQAFLRSIGKPMAVDIEYQDLIGRMRNAPCGAAPRTEALPGPNDRPAGSAHPVAVEANDTLRVVSIVDVS